MPSFPHVQAHKSVFFRGLVNHPPSIALQITTFTTSWPPDYLQILALQRALHSCQAFPEANILSRRVIAARRGAGDDIPKSAINDKSFKQQGPKTVNRTFKALKEFPGTKPHNSRHRSAIQLRGLPYRATMQDVKDCGKHGLGMYVFGGGVWGVRCPALRASWCSVLCCVNGSSVLSTARLSG